MDKFLLLGYFTIRTFDTPYKIPENESRFHADNGLNGSTADGETRSALPLY